MVGRADYVELRQLVVFIDIDLLLDKAGMVVFANQFRHSHCAWRKVSTSANLLCTVRGESFLVSRRNAARNAGDAFRSTSSRKTLIAGLLEITEGDAIYPRHVFLCRVSWTSSRKSSTADRIRRRVSSSIGLETTRPAAIALPVLFAFECGCYKQQRRRRRRRYAPALSVLVPEIEVVGAFRVLLLPVIDHHPIGFNAGRWVRR